MYTPLHKAAGIGHHLVALSLLDKGAKPCREAKSGEYEYFTNVVHVVSLFAIINNNNEKLFNAQYVVVLYFRHTRYSPGGFIKITNSFFQ